MLLAIDLSTRYASIALSDGDALLAEMNWRADRRHGVDALDVIRELVARVGAEVGDVRAVGVALGPGSFNGLRVALATAKALAFALDAPLYGAPTLDIIGWGARPASGAGEPIWALLSSGRDDVFAARYDPASVASTWAPVAPASPAAQEPLLASSDDGGLAYLTMTPAALANLVQGDATFAGEWRDATRATLEAALGSRAHFASPFTARRAAWLAELVHARVAEGLAPDDPHTLEPLYLRRPNITTSARATMGGLTVPTLGETGQQARSDGAGEEENRHALQS